MQRVISYSDLQRSGLLDEIAIELGRFSIGFVKIIEQPGKEDVIFAGSGTLIHFNNHYGILTADHVLQNLNDAEMGIILPSIGPNSPHRITIGWNNAQKIHVGPAANTASGPDLGIYILHQQEAEKLKTWSIFYNLDKRRDHMLTNPKDIEIGGWFLCGAPVEWASDSEPERSFTKVKSFRGFCGAAVVTAERSESDFDYLDVGIKPKGKYEGPLNYQGVSGGGLWQIVMEERNNILRIKEYLLSGVAFYQVVENNLPKTIICHGRRSIYETLYKSM